MNRQIDVDVIFFDAAGTLFEVRGSVGLIYSRIAARYGVIAEPAELESAFRAAFHAKSSEVLASGNSGGVREEKAWWKDVVRRAFAGRMTPGILNEYFEEVFEAFRGAGAYELCADTRACLGRLRACGYRLAVLSNFDSRLFDVLANLGIDSFFEQVILSWHAGSSKPDPAIFLRALEVMHVPAKRALHVGDSLQEDFAGASAAGMHAALLDRRGRHPGWDAGCRMEDLSRLFSILRKCSGHGDAAGGAGCE